jgi:hypothetical protein
MRRLRRSERPIEIRDDVVDRHRTALVVASGSYPQKTAMVSLFMISPEALDLRRWCAGDARVHRDISGDAGTSQACSWGRRRTFAQCGDQT